MNFDYEFFYKGFLGYSLEQDFEYWSLAHLLPIALLVVGILLVYRYREKIASWKGEETLRFLLGALLILNEGFYYWRLMYVGNGGSSDPQQLITYLPLQVCEWSAYLAAFMLMKKSKNIFDICYYVCLTLGVIPFFMPSVIMQTGPTYARYYQFWIEHLVPVFAVFYMMFVHGFKANYKKVYKPFAVLAVLATLAIIANLNIEGANFMYLAKGTDGDSIANVLPQSIPVRLVLYIGILCVLFALVSLPQIIKEVKAHKAKKALAIAEETVQTETTTEEGTLEENQTSQTE
jgi:hypothetical integral membrane protein (TIGR02206 family)